MRMKTKKNFISRVNNNRDDEIQKNDDDTNVIASNDEHGYDCYYDSDGEGDLAYWR